MISWANGIPFFAVYGGYYILGGNFTARRTWLLPSSPDTPIHQGCLAGLVIATATATNVNAAIPIPKNGIQAEQIHSFETSKDTMHWEPTSDLECSQVNFTILAEDPTKRSLVFLGDDCFGFVMPCEALSYNIHLDPAKMTTVSPMMAPPSVWAKVREKEYRNCRTVRFKCPIQSYPLFTKRVPVTHAQECERRMKKVGIPKEESESPKKLHLIESFVEEAEGERDVSELHITKNPTEAPASFSIQVPSQIHLKKNKAKRVRKRPHENNSNSETSDTSAPSPSLSKRPKLLPSGTYNPKTLPVGENHIIPNISPGPTATSLGKPFIKAYAIEKTCDKFDELSTLYTDMVEEREFLNTPAAREIVRLYKGFEEKYSRYLDLLESVKDDIQKKDRAVELFFQDRIRKVEVLQPLEDECGVQVGSGVWGDGDGSGSGNGNGSGSSSATSTSPLGLLLDDLVTPLSMDRNGDGADTGFPSWLL